jgi:hypothetical protein
MAEFKKTITSIFMVPTLKINRDTLHANDFLNGYAKDVSREEHYDDACYLLFRPKNIDRFREFLDSEYDRTKDIIEDYDHPHGFVVVVYKLNPKFKSDFDLIRDSKYSKTSPEFQALFPKVVKIKVNGLSREEISLQVRIFKKTDDLRQFWEDKFQVDLMDHVEFWDGYREENETLTEKKLNSYLKKEEAL